MFIFNSNFSCPLFISALSSSISSFRLCNSSNFWSTSILCVSAAAFNFGYSFRQNWFRNYVFVFLFLLFTSMQFGMTLSASKFSCIWTVNCDNDHVVRPITSSEPGPINNAFATTVMPVEFRGLLVGLMVANLIIICAWNYFIVNGVCMGRVSGKLMRNNSRAREIGEAPSA